jgi:L-ascorbate metabolism protein UlaG (beta-lactamase superfamily)
VTGFEALLRRKLGPIADLVARSGPREAPPLDPAALFFRRAVGLEASVRPEDTWARVHLGPRELDPSARPELARAEARTILGLTRWRTPAEAGVEPARLWRWVEAGLLFFATTRPEGEEACLSGEPGAIERARRGELTIARRAAAWPIPAIETAVEVAPMPFMPRGRDLAGAELVGFRVGLRERGHEVLGVTVTGSRALGLRLRRLLALLDGRRRPEEVLAALPRVDRAEAGRLLALLDDAGALEALERPLASPWSASRGPEVTWLGHGAALLRLGDTHVLVDPLFFAPSEPEERWLSAPRPDPRALPPLDAVLITHGDNAHLNAASLAMLPASTPVYVPRTASTPPAHQVDLRGVLRTLGFEQVLELDAWTAFGVGGVRITALPFEGEDWGLDLAKLTYLVESADASVYLSADSTFGEAACAHLAALERPVDLALLGVSGNAEALVMPAGFGYGDFYAEWVPRARHREWVQHCAGPREAARAAAAFRPRFAFGYAAGGASFIRTEYSDTGDHAAFAELLQSARAADPGATRPVALPLGEPVPLAALDRCPPGAGALDRGPGR